MVRATKEQTRSIERKVDGREKEGQKECIKAGLKCTMLA